MVLRMANPTKNKYGVYMFRVRVPADLVHLVGRKVQSCSLGTKDPKAARERFLVKLNEVEREYTALRASLEAGPEALPYRQTVALAGEIYRELANDAEQAATPCDLEMFFEGVCARSEDRHRLDSLAAAKLREHGLASSPDNRRAIVDELAQNTFPRLARRVAQLQQGNFAPDPNLAHFPAVAPPQQPATPGTTLDDLFDLWERDHLAHDRNEKTARLYRAALDKFKRWLGHNDPRQVSRGIIRDFLDQLVHEEGLSTKTVNARYLTCIKAVFRAGYERERIPDNPAAGTRMPVAHRPQTRPKGYTDAEARLILRLANAADQPTGRGARERRSAYNLRVRRWVPWVLCYTGARVAEITQLRKQDIMELDGIPFLRITPEAGSVKTGEYRDVPIHPHLVELGFLSFVAACPDGPLFYDPKRADSSQPPAQWAGNALRRWLVQELGDQMPQGVAPNHGWRHRFKTVGREAGIEAGYLDAIQGHRPRTAGEAYGHVSLGTLSREMQKVPRIELDQRAGR
jgi:integrase